MYKVSESIRSIHSRDGAVVLDVRLGHMFNLNFVGSQIFTLLKNGSAQPEIIDQLVRDFGVNRHLAETDVQEFLHTLRTYNLVEPVIANGAA